jgi:hypothetical protein
MDALTVGASGWSGATVSDAVTKVLMEENSDVFPETSVQAIWKS